jgi:hypothetical protein
MYLIQQTGIPKVVESWLAPHRNEIVEQGLAPQAAASYYLVKGTMRGDHPLIDRCLEACHTLVPPEWKPRWSVAVRDESGQEWTFGQWFPWADRPRNDLLPAAPTQSVHFFVGARRGSGALVFCPLRQHEPVQVYCHYQDTRLVALAEDAQVTTGDRLVYAQREVQVPVSAALKLHQTGEVLQFSREQIEKGLLDEAIEARLPLFLPRGFL